MIPEQYMIITQEDKVMFYYASDVKEAICKYASWVPFGMRNDLSQKIISSLSVEEAVEFFNHECWSWEDKIKQILTGYITLYKGE